MPPWLWSLGAVAAVAMICCAVWWRRRPWAKPPTTAGHAGGNDVPGGQSEQSEQNEQPEQPEQPPPPKVVSSDLMPDVLTSAPPSGHSLPSSCDSAAKKRASFAKSKKAMTSADLAPDESTMQDVPKAQPSPEKWSAETLYKRVVDQKVEPGKAVWKTSD